MAVRKGWTAADMPDLAGKVAIVTGANAGLGAESVLELARAGATVTLACRSVERGEAVASRVRTVVPVAQLSVLPLDLADAGSIADFAGQFMDRNARLDILLNNAGVVNLETHEQVNGIDAHMAVNHLGHFALTARLLPLLQATAGSRVVTVSSLASRQGEIVFDDLGWERRTYQRIKAYGDSKLANLYFTWGLQKRLDKAGAPVLSLAAHPGLAGTERQQTRGAGGFVTRWLAASVASGVRPQLYAAADPKVEPAAYYGPRFGFAGYPVQLAPLDGQLREGTERRLWQLSEGLTGVGVGI